MTTTNEKWIAAIEEVHQHGGSTDNHWRWETEAIIGGRYVPSCKRVIGFWSWCKDGKTVKHDNLPPIQITEIATPMWKPKDSEDSVQWSILIKRFFLIAKQDGEGCDYTIGCGIKIHELKNVQYMKAAIEDAEYIISQEYNCQERHLKSAIVYEVESTESIDLATLYLRITEDQAIARASKEELAEREMLAKLKAKYPNA